MPTLLEVLAALLPGASGSVPSVSMPVPPELDWTIAQVRPFGLEGGRGARHFQRGLEIALGAGDTITLLALAAGTVRWVGAGYHVGEASSRDGRSYETVAPALVLQLDPPVARKVRELLSPAAARVELEPWHAPIPLDLPDPYWVVYEGPEAQPASTYTPTAEAFWGFPIDFPHETETLADLASQPGQAFLASDIETTLDAIVTRLLDDDTLEVWIDGSADDRGEADYNLALSQRRADMVRERLVQIRAAHGGDPATEGPFRRRIHDHGLGEKAPWTALPLAEARALNRRVEILVARAGTSPAGPAPAGTDAGVPIQEVRVAAGDEIGRLDQRVTVTVLDAKGRVLDPLDLVRRFDVEHRTALHPLADHRNPYAPSIASGWVHCLTPRARPADPADPTTAVTADGAVADDVAYFSFTEVQDADGNPLQTLLTQRDVQDGDVVSICDLAQVKARATIRRAITLVGSETVPTAENMTTLTPADPAESILVVDLDADADATVGVGLRGIAWQGGARAGGGGCLRIAAAANVSLAMGRVGSGRTPIGGGAVRIELCTGVHVEAVSFLDNQAESGAGLYLGACKRVLVRDTRWSRNVAVEDGGAILAEDCRDVVIAGTPPEEAILAAARAMVGGGSLDSTAAALSADPYGARFEDNKAGGSGGAVAFRRSTFRVEHCHFRGNAATGAGGGVAAFLDEADLPDLRDRAFDGGAWELIDRSAVARCAFTYNAGTAGGAVAVVAEGIERGDLAGGDLDEVASPDQIESDDRGAVCFVGHNLLFGNGRDATNSAAVSIGNTFLGGAAHLMRGVFFLRGNLVWSNGAFSAGGGLSCIDHADVRIEGNRIRSNSAQAAGTAGLADLGRGGGGGIYARWLLGSRRTRLELVDNEIGGNETAGDGGGILATAGALVRLRGGNSLSDNMAYRNGGAISARNADVEVAGADTFDTNEAGRDSRGANASPMDGGAIYVVGVSMFELDAQPDVPARTAISVSALLRARAAASGLPAVEGNGASGGARLAVLGSGPARPSFTNNEASGQGGAIFVGQQSFSPLFIVVDPAFMAGAALDDLTARPRLSVLNDMVPGTSTGEVLQALRNGDITIANVTGGLVPTVPDLTVGLVTGVTIEGATFVDNRSASGQATPDNTAGSTIALQELDDEWVEDALGLLATGLAPEKGLQILDHVLGYEAGFLQGLTYRLADLDLQGRQGSSILLIRTVRQTPAAPDGRVVIDPSVSVHRSPSAGFGEDFRPPSESITPRPLR